MSKQIKNVWVQLSKQTKKQLFIVDGRMERERQKGETREREREEVGGREKEKLDFFFEWVSFFHGDLFLCMRYVCAYDI